ncbi:hypothetical protein [Streptomyces sp. NPDC101149]|uniref:hypothetical protein n=1 Tax=Streptomyces sp. NPDC101149 TaxID=3366113 RepID=UPI0037F2B84B
MQNATLLRSHDRPMEQQASSAHHWTAVRAHPLLVLSLRNPAGADTWKDTWRSLTALVFSCGLATRETKALEVHYDAGTSRRFDACLSIPSSRIAAEVTADDLAQVPGARMETVMGHGPFLHHRPTAGHDGRPAPTAPQPSAGAPHSTSLVPAWPRYHVYACSPALAEETPVITDTYITLAAFAPVRP